MLPVEPSVDEIQRDYVVSNLEFMIVILLGALGYWIFDSRRRHAERAEPRKPPKASPQKGSATNFTCSSGKGAHRGGQWRHENKSSSPAESKPRNAGMATRATRDTHLHRFRALAATRDVEGILRTLNIMAQQGLQPDDEVFHAIFCRFPPNLQSSSVGVLRIFKSLLDGGFTPSKATLTQVMELLAKTDSWEPALEFLRSTEKCFGIPAEAIQYAKLCLTCEAIGNLTAAKKVHEAMVEDLGGAAVEEGLTGTRFANWIKAPTPRPGKVADLVVQSFEQVDEQGDSLQWKRLVVQFAVANGLDRVQLEKLRLPKKQLQWIIDEHFLFQLDGEDDTATTMLMRYVREAAEKPEEFWLSYPTSNDVKKRLLRFIEINGLDRKCREMLKTLPPALAQKVMGHEYLVKVDPGRGTASSKVVGHIMRFRRLNNATG